MSFRRIPFQFSTTDPAERQRELEKRFGVPSQNKMYVDAANPLTMGSGFNTSTNSPRFQHRVPMFVDGMPAQSSVDSSTCENKSPKVRVIPIEIEKDESSPSSRHRTFSGPAEIHKQLNKEMCSQKDDASTLKRSMEDLTKPSKMKAGSGPRVYNVPIKVEQSSVREKKTKSEKGKTPIVKSHSKVNGCDTPKLDEYVEPEPSPLEKDHAEKDRMRININNSLKKIDCVQEELKSFEIGVNDFSGTAKDKQYRFLDEMLTRCMIKLDDIETMGNEEIRSARKKVVKMVQACIDLLESKVNIAIKPDTSANTNGERLEATEKHDNSEQSSILGEVKSSTDDIPENNQLVKNTDECQISQSESLTQEGINMNHSAGKPEVDARNDVPEAEMAEVTSTSSDLSQNEKTGIDNSMTVQSLPDVFSNEIEMTEVTSQTNLQDQKELSKPEVSSTNVENVSVVPAQKDDLIEANMTDVTSTSNNSSENRKVEIIPEISSSVLQSEAVASNFEQFSAETTVTEDNKFMRNIKTQEANHSNSDSNLPSSIPEVEMKEIVEDSCKNNNAIPLDEQCNLESKCSSNNEPN